MKFTFDPARRQTIKLIGATAVFASVPSTSVPSIRAAVPSGTDASSLDLRESAFAAYGAELSLDLQVDDEAVLSMTNNSDRLIIVRHVYPGIVHAGEQTYNINSAFERSAYAISARSTRRVVLQAASRQVSETDFPRWRERDKPQRIASLIGNNQHGLIVNSTRSYYA